MLISNLRLFLSLVLLFACQWASAQVTLDLFAQKGDRVFKTAPGKNRASYGGTIAARAIIPSATAPDSNCLTPPEGHGGPGCDDAVCEANVCELDPFCCDVAWDGFCVEEATDLCPITGPSPDSCFVPHPSPGCDDGQCQATVCEVDPFCCDVEWDQLCADEATELCASQPPENDLCGSPFLLELQDQAANATETTRNATVDTDAPFCGTPVTAPGVWYAIAGTGNTLTATTCDGNTTATTDYDTKLSVYCADCEALTCIGGNDDDFSGDPSLCSTVSWPSEDGALYRILVHGFGSAEGDFGLHITDDGVPASGQIMCAATAADLAITKDADQSVAIPGADSIVYTLVADNLGISLSNCTAERAKPRCDDLECTEAVCADDPFCCAIAWDGFCADQATELCPNLPRGGPDLITGATVQDTFPAGLQNCSWTCVASGGGSCTAGPESGNINDIVDIPRENSELTYTVNCDIGPDAIGFLSNEATITPPPDVPDPILSNNSAKAFTLTTPQVDVSVTKDDSKDVHTPDEPLIYTIEVSNSGPSTAAGITVEDMFPLELLECTWTCTPSAGSSCSPGPVTDDIDDSVTLPPGGSVIYTATCQADPQDGNYIVLNLASAAIPAGTTDIDENNNFDIDETILVFPIPTLSLGALAALAIVVLGLGAWRRKRRQG